MRIKIIEVGAVAKVKTYFEFPLKYEQDGKVQDKKMFSFNEASYKVLKDAKPDEQYEVKLMKDKNGYWQWESVVEAHGAPAAASAGRTSTYETPEERAHKHVLIVRQSCLAQAVNFEAGLDKNIDNLLEVAGRFEDWVNRD